MGRADSISFPHDEAGVVEVVRAIGAAGGAITTQGARTGIVGGAAPNGGHVLNLSRMKAIGNVLRDERTGEAYIIAQPGALLSEVREVVEKEGLIFPPDPTETTCSIGGMAACNASGAMSFFYGPTRNWVRALRVVLADGSVLSIRRGTNFAEGRSFRLVTEGGRVIEGALPSYSLPKVKSAAGYYAADNMDMIDLFIGMEGTLGIITEVELRLIPKPPAVAGLTIFPSDEESAIKMVRAVRGEAVDGLPSMTVKPVAIEFFNHDALDLLRRMKASNDAFAEIPSIGPHFHTAVYIEFHAESGEGIEEAMEPVMEAMVALDISDEDAWFADIERELAPIKAFRHAVPEAVNLLIDERRRSCPTLTKLSTDMSVTDSELESALRMYNEGLAESGLESVIFGHIGDNHVHVNILPNSIEDYEKGKALYLSWARRVVAMGGSISAEHGIGKIKAPMLELMYGEQGVSEMRSLKRLFDPEMMLNPGDLFG